MRKTILTTLLSALAVLSFSQGKLIKEGDLFPDIAIKNIINAPVKTFSLNEAKDKKIYIINLWGTWCSPCIPEMDSLAKLQNANPSKIQVIGISDDSTERLNAYLKKKPSKIWLATDTSYLFYSMFAFANVGQSAIVDSNHKILAFVKTDFINQKMIDKLIKGLAVQSNANLTAKKINASEDLFGVDSTMRENFTVRSYMQGHSSMSKTYRNGYFENRRISYVNCCVDRMFTDAYQISSPKQVIYEFNKKLLFDYNNKLHLYCLDLLVNPTQKDSLYTIFQQRLKQVFPIKAKTEYRNIPVYVLTVAKNKQFTAPVSTTQKMSYSFTGRGFDGQGITIAQFSDLYLNNELETPMVDETGLKGIFDIKTTVEIRNLEGIKKMISDLGLEVTKAERPMRVLVLSK